MGERGTARKSAGVCGGEGRKSVCVGGGGAEKVGEGGAEKVGLGGGRKMRGEGVEKGDLCE